MFVLAPEAAADGLECLFSAMKRRFVPQQISPLSDRLVSGCGVARMLRALCKKKPGTPLT
jgi:hypothetical protein